MMLNIGGALSLVKGGGKGIQGSARVDSTPNSPQVRSARAMRLVRGGLHIMFLYLVLLGALVLVARSSSTPCASYLESCGECCLGLVCSPQGLCETPLLHAEASHHAAVAELLSHHTQARVHDSLQSLNRAARGISQAALRGTKIKKDIPIFTAFVFTPS